MPGAPRSTAASVAAAASSTWMNEKIPRPFPTMGKRRLRTRRKLLPSGAK